jgi:predicted ATPase/transcriptional regulator with XRE-family HTH domain
VWPFNSSCQHYTTYALYSGGRLGYNKGAENDPKYDPNRGDVNRSARMEPISSFGYWLRRRRKALDLTQDELARQIGCAIGTLKKIETDERRPSKQLAERLADCLALPAAERAAFVKAARAELATDQLAVITQPIDQQDADTTLPGSTAHPNNLPAQPTALIGREREIAAVVAMLRRDDVRLLTLTGPGGTGKTRLALQAAAELLDAFADGVWFVNLAPIRDSALLLPTIAQALGVIELGGQPIEERLKAYLRAKHLLLLDNFEQVIDGAPRIAELLASAPGLKVLVTSRATLHLYGEHEYGVPPLALPPTDDGRRTTDDRKAGDPTLERPNNRAETISQYESVRLFIARARAAKADFAVTNDNAPAVADICHRLNGLPLAIELAAAQVKLFPPQALLARLGNRLQMLTGGPRDLPERQQTLRGTIAWSYDLLDDGEQALFRRLEIFIGGCTLEAAEAVCVGVGSWGLGVGSAPPAPNFQPPTPVLDRLASLIDKSLLRQEEGPDGESRFPMLETVREYALERLEESGELETMRLRHAEYFVEFAEAAEPHIREAPGNVWWQRIVADYDDLRAIFAECQAGVIDAEYGLRLGHALWQFWTRTSRHTEGFRWLTVALERGVPAATPIRAKALIAAGQLAAAFGDQPASTLLEAGLTLAREVRDKQAIAEALAELGRLARFQGNYARAVMLEEESLVLFREIGDAPHMIGTVLGLGDAALDQGDTTQAMGWFQEALTFNDQFMSNWAMIMLARIAYVQGDGKRAWGILQECLTCSRSLGDFIALAATLIELGRVARLGNDLAGAIAYFSESLTLLQDTGGHEFIANGLEGMAGIATFSEQPQRAARLFGAAEMLRTAANIPLPPVMRAEYDQAVAAIRAQLDESTFAAAWAAGRALTLEQAIAEALNR